MRDAMPGKSKCKSHGSGGVRTAEGKKSIASSRSKGLGDTRANRLIYKKDVYKLYILAKLVGITWIGRPPQPGKSINHHLD